mmetsp:Transcript_11697/g.49236  ORF Transcript_11697/g.49236 Transcript_11697/m.49236 type:complete len:249 (+) Transcript_11697:2542-3288(+)
MHVHAAFQEGALRRRRGRRHHHLGLVANVHCDTDHPRRHAKDTAAQHCVDGRDLHLPFSFDVQLATKCIQVAIRGIALHTTSQSPCAVLGSGRLRSRSSGSADRCWTRRNAPLERILAVESGRVDMRNVRVGSSAAQQDEVGRRLVTLAHHHQRACGDALPLDAGGARLRPLAPSLCPASATCNHFHFPGVRRTVGRPAARILEDVFGCRGDHHSEQRDHAHQPAEHRQHRQLVDQDEGKEVEVAEAR